MTAAKTKSWIVVVLDRSGSMTTMKSDMEGGLNQFVQDQQKVPGECKFTLAQFDGEYEVVEDGIDIQDVGGAYKLIPRGATALLDALGKTITTVQGQIDALPKTKKPKKTIVCIITDGYENASKEWQRDDVIALVKAREADGWEFMYLGANQDAIATGAGFGISSTTSMTYDTGSRAVHATYAMASANVSAVRSGLSHTVAFTDDQRKKAMES